MRRLIAGLCLAAVAGLFCVASPSFAQDAPVPAPPPPAVLLTLPPPYLYLPVKPNVVNITGPHFHRWGHGPYYTFVFGE